MNILKTPPAKALDFQVTTLRFQTNDTGAPQLGSIDLSPFNMDGSGYSRPSSYSSPNVPQTSPLSSHNDPSHRRPSHVRLQSNAFTRKPLGFIGDSVNNHGHDTDTSPPPIPDSFSLEDSPSWSSAIGHATLGKSGRVIERLMADIDRLKRELNAEISHRQEVEKRDEANRKRISVMVAENANLQQGKDIDSAALRRRDRKMEELKAELENERRRRITAEETAREAAQQREEALAHCRKEVSSAREQAKQAESHADILATSFRQLKNEYRQRTSALSRDLQTLARDREQERKTVKKLDVVVEQMRHELERANKTNGQMLEDFAAYKENSESMLLDLQRETTAREGVGDQLREEMERALKETKHLLQVTRAVRFVEDS